MTSLRTIHGLDLMKISNEFGNQFKDELVTKSNKYILTEKLSTKNSSLLLTTEGKLFVDGIAADLFF